MADKKATRESYGAALAELGDKYDFVVLDADLAAATKTGVFKKKFPERFFDCGIAEGNMVALRQVSQPPVRRYSRPPSLCSPQAEHTSRSETLSAIPTLT